MSLPYFDTSALAKWYLPEPFSEQVEAMLRQLEGASISRLTAVEFRCLHGRKQRAGQISAEVSNLNQRLFEAHIRQGVLGVLPITESTFALADDLLAGMTDIPLRTLDVMHLAVARENNCSAFATADRTLADAARALGLTTHSFY